MLQGAGIASFTLDNFDSIDAWLFSSLTENYKFRKSICESRESFKIFVAHISQPRVYDPVFSYYFKTSKQLLNMHIIFVYNSNCGRQTLNKLLNKGGVFFSSRTWQGSWKKKFFFCLQSQVSDRKFSKILTTRKVPQKLLCLQSKAN